MQEFVLNKKKVKISSNSQQKKQPKASRKPDEDSRKRNSIRGHFLRSKGIRYSQRKDLRLYEGVEDGTSSVNWTDNGVLNTLKSTIEITNMELHEENKLGSMQNYKERAHRDARFQKMKEVRELKEIWCSKDTNCGKASQ